MNYWSVENLVALHDRLQTVESYDAQQIRHLQTKIRNIAITEILLDTQTGAFDFGQLIEKTAPKPISLELRDGWVNQHTEIYHKPFEYQERCFIVVTERLMREGMVREGFLGLVPKKLDMYEAQQTITIKEVQS